MLFRDVVDLVPVIHTKDDYGEAVEQDGAARQVFANRKSVRQSEFYQAAMTGMRPELMFEVRSIEYADEPKLRHNGQAYRIIRTYSKNGEITELICSGIVGE